MIVPYGPPAPALVADRLMATGPRGVVFGPVSLSVAAGEVLAIVGASGSGRTSLLLALAGRLRVAGGRVTVCGGSSGRGARARALRRAVSVGRAGEVMDLDELWTVGDALADRAVLAGRAVEPAVRDLLATVGVDLPSAMPLHAVGPLQSTLLHAALATAEDRPVLVFDDVDRGLGPRDEARVWGLLAAVAAEGRAVVGTTTDTSVATAAGATILDLGTLPA